MHTSSVELGTAPVLQLVAVFQSPLAAAFHEFVQTSAAAAYCTCVARLATTAAANTRPSRAKRRRESTRATAGILDLRRVDAVPVDVAIGTRGATWRLSHCGQSQRHPTFVQRS